MHTKHNINYKQQLLKISLKKLYRFMRYLGRGPKKCIQRKSQNTKQINKITSKFKFEKL